MIEKHMEIEDIRKHTASIKAFDSLFFKPVSHRSRKRLVNLAYDNIRMWVSSTAFNSSLSRIYVLPPPIIQLFSHEFLIEYLDDVITIDELVTKTNIDTTKYLNTIKIRWLITLKNKFNIIWSELYTNKMFR
jgi:hypothetical protein